MADMLSVGTFGWWTTAVAVVPPGGVPIGTYGPGIEGMLRSLATTYRRADVADDWGAVTTIWTSELVNLACDIQPAYARMADENPRYGRLPPEVTHVMYCEPADINERDRVVLTDTPAGAVSGPTFEVEAVLDIAYHGRLLTIWLVEERS